MTSNIYTRAHRANGARRLDRRRLRREAAQREQKLIKLFRAARRDNPTWDAARLANAVARYSPPGTTFSELMRIAEIFRPP
jgi:hypothetical protein